MAYDLRISNTDWRHHLDGSAAAAPPLENMVNALNLKLETVRELKAKLNYQLDVQTAVKFSWPGLKPPVTKFEPPTDVKDREKDKKKTLGNKVQKKGGRS